jgi:hypothetical protein
MYKQVVEITSFANISPEVGVWYKYFDEIFISVVPKKNIKPYIRRKAMSVENKTDKKMCDWHFNWQYVFIESTYGLAVTGKKTFEIPIVFQGERHIIDSVVNNVAIEFQHTLSVSIDEMDERYYAHSQSGFIPYLLIDFTNERFASIFSSNGGMNYMFDLEAACLSYSNRVSKFYASNPTLIYKKLRKWAHSSYFQNNRLFIEFSDLIVRPLMNFIQSDKKARRDKYITYTKEEFIRNLTA